MQFRLAKATMKLEVTFAYDATPSTIYRNNTTRTGNQAIGAEPSDFLRVRLLNSPPAPRILRDEDKTLVTLMTAGGEFITLPALISPHYPDSFLPSDVAAVLGINQKTLEGDEARVFLTPMGRIKSDRSALISFELEDSLGFPALRAIMCVRTVDGLLGTGLGMIFGQCFIEHCGTQKRANTRTTGSSQPSWEPQLHAAGNGGEEKGKKLKGEEDVGRW